MIIIIIVLMNEKMNWHTPIYRCKCGMDMLCKPFRFWVHSVNGMTSNLKKKTNAHSMIWLCHHLFCCHCFHAFCCVLFFRSVLFGCKTVNGPSVAVSIEVKPTEWNGGMTLLKIDNIVIKWIIEICKYHILWITIINIMNVYAYKCLSNH